MLTDHILNNVRQVVGEAVANNRVPAGAFGAIQGASSALRDEGADRAQIRLTEDLSVAMLRLEWGLRKRDEGAIERAREQLQAISDQLSYAFDAGGAAIPLDS